MEVKKMSENENVMTKEEFAVYSAKVNEWVKETTPLIQNIEDETVLEDAEYDMEDVVKLLDRMQRRQLYTAELKDRIHKAGRAFPVGIWPFSRGRGSSLPVEIQEVLNNHLAIQGEVYSAFWDICVETDGAMNLTSIRLSGRNKDDPHGQYADKDAFVSTMVNAEKQNITQKYRKGQWDGNAEFNFTDGVAADSVDSGDEA